jgi:hypothetical protein
MAHEFRQLRIIYCVAPPRNGREQFGDRAIVIGNQHRFTIRGEADVFAQLALKTGRVTGAGSTANSPKSA